MAIPICAIVTLILFVLLALDVFGKMPKKYSGILGVISMIVIAVDIPVFIVSFIMEFI